MANFRKITSFHTVEEFQDFLLKEKIDIPCVSELTAPLKLAEKVRYGNAITGNRWAALPMEGWDCLPDGAPSELTLRRWRRFAQSGAKLLFGTEACAVMHSGKSNTRQLEINEKSYDKIAYAVEEMRRVHAEKFGTADDFRIGLQLTHSGRFAHPNDDKKLEPRTAYSHPLLDKKFHCGKECVVSDGEAREIISHFHSAAKLAKRAGFDFADVKNAHGYLAHEFLSAVDRPGDYGGSFENRTRFFREICQGIQSEAPGLEIAMRLSLTDFLPFIKDEKGNGVPMDWNFEKPYPYAFGGDGTGYGWNPEEPVRFIRMAQKLFGLNMVCSTIGSPYYNVHYQRPAYFAVSDGYPPPVHPLIQVARHIGITAQFKKLCPDILFAGSGYTCLQEYLPYAAEAVLRNGGADFIGIGRMVLSYPEICSDVLDGKPLDHCRICRTIGDCTTAPRNGFVSGCYPLDHFYKCRPEAELLRKAKSGR